jgi:hypothetical protein
MAEIELNERQLEAIDRYFRKTCEPYDDWEWDGEEVHIFLKQRIIERYDYMFSSNN